MSGAGMFDHCEELYLDCPCIYSWFGQRQLYLLFFFYVHVTVHRNKFLFNKTNRRTDFPNLFCQQTLHVSGSSSARHQEFIHCLLGTGICHTRLKTAF